MSHPYRIFIFLHEETYTTLFISIGFIFTADKLCLFVVVRHQSDYMTNSGSKEGPVGKEGGSELLT